jgi:cell division septal protein FtsQ
MPFGIQVVGPNGADAKVLQVATALERVLASRVETSRPVVDPTRLSAAGPNAEGHA